MENKTNPSKKVKYTTEELVRIGDHIHDSSCSFIMCINDLDDQDNKKNILFSSHGDKDDMVMMFVQVLDKNPKLELLFIKAIATYNVMKHQDND